MEDEWQLRKVRVPKGAHLSQSKDSEGAQRDLLREDGTNKLLGPAESMPVDEDDLDRYRQDAAPLQDSSEPSLGTRLAQQVIEEIIASIDWEAVFERVVVPAIKRTKDRVGNRLRATFPRTKTEIVESVPVQPPTSSTAMNSEDQQATFSVSRDEYRQRVFTLLAAEACASRERETLARARVEEDDMPKELVRAIRLVLEGKVSSLGVDELDAVREFLKEAPATAEPYPLPQAAELEVVVDPRGPTACERAVENS